MPVTAILSFSATVERDGKVHLHQRGWETERKPAGTLTFPPPAGKKTAAQDGISALWSISRQSVGARGNNDVGGTDKSRSAPPAEWLGFPRPLTVSTGPVCISRWQGGADLQCSGRATCGLLTVTPLEVKTQTHEVDRIWKVSRVILIRGQV